jgi:tetratricopeptide (TPR) repeat protein
MLTKAVEAADLYGNVDKAAEANGLINQTLMQKANAFLNDKDYASAITVYEQIMTLDATNGNAALRLGQCHASLGNSDEAEQAFLTAAANGQEKQANKQLSNLYVKKSQASYKEKKYQEAIDFAVKSNEYLENANAYRFAASASQQLGKNADCIANYEKYLELSPNAKDAAGVKYTIAALYQQAGNKAKAKEFYQMVANDPQYGPGAQEQLKTL